MGKMVDMKFHETVTIEIGGFESWRVTRVYNGWIYRYENMRQPNASHSVFVPKQLEIDDISPQYD